MHPPQAAGPIPAEAWAEHQRRLCRLACHKRRTRLLARWLAARGLLTPCLQRLHDCHAWMVFRYDPGRQRFRLAQARSCNLALLCPLCAIRRAARAGDAYQRRVATLLDASPRLLLSYAVLTIRNREDLAERFGHLQRHARLLLARRQAANSARRGHRRHAYACRCCLAPAVGGAYSFEVKRGARSGLWHPHLNLLLLSGDPIDPRRLRDEWRALTGDSHNVYCRPRPNAPGTFVEIFKYALKFSALSPADTFAVYQLLTGRRLMGSFGALHGIAVPRRDSRIESPSPVLLYGYEGGEYRLRSEVPLCSDG